MEKGRIRKIWLELGISPFNEMERQERENKMAVIARKRENAAVRKYNCLVHGNALTM